MQNNSQETSSKNGCSFFSKDHNEISLQEAAKLHRYVRFDDINSRWNKLIVIPIIKLLINFDA